MRIYPFIRTSRKSGTASLRFRLKEGNGFERWFKSDINVDIAMFDNSKGTYKLPRMKAGAAQTEEYKAQLEAKQELDKRIATVVSAITAVFLHKGRDIQKEEFAELVDKQLNPEKYKISIFEQFEVYANKPGKNGLRSEGYKRSFRQCRLHLERFEAWKQVKQHGFKLSFENFTKQTAEEFYSFLVSEDKNFDKQGKPLPEYRGTHYIDLFNKFRRRGKRLNEHTANKNMLILKIVFNDKFGKYSDDNPLRDYELPVNKPDDYVDPFFLPVSERNKIAAHDFGSDKENAYRDAFIFQCLTGERVSDLMSFTVSSIQNNVLSYVAIKTQGENKKEIFVPLNDVAKDIYVRNSKDKKANDKLFPIIVAENSYNRHIKKMLTECGITRTVKTEDTFGNISDTPINECATSHTARKTFIGNLYNKTHDPAIISKMSGHAENSKAFARYRKIDNDALKQVIDLL